MSPIVAGQQVCVNSHFCKGVRVQICVCQECKFKLEHGDKVCDHIRAWLRWSLVLSEDFPVFYNVHRLSKEVSLLLVCRAEACGAICCVSESLPCLHFYASFDVAISLGSQLWMQQSVLILSVESNKNPRSLRLSRQHWFCESSWPALLVLMKTSVFFVFVYVISHFLHC